MAIDEQSKLTKLEIHAYADFERNDALGTVAAMFNPSSFSMRYGNVYSESKGLNAGASPARFSHAQGKTLRLNLVLDGTGVAELAAGPSASTLSVAERVDEFLRLCFVKKGELHEPTYLRLHWGAGVLEPGFKCRLQSVDIKYTSFTRTGAPLRAELDSTFVEDAKEAEETSSPDLSHRRVVTAGDTLTLLCREIYGSARHYLRVARYNGLDELELRPGQELDFPPLARRGRRGS